eukprot:jgi/Botrbrau1/9273/Bobra.0111s0001.1
MPRAVPLHTPSLPPRPTSPDPLPPSAAQQRRVMILRQRRRCGALRHLPRLRAVTSHTPNLRPGPPSPSIACLLQDPLPPSTARQRRVMILRQRRRRGLLPIPRAVTSHTLTLPPEPPHASPYPTSGDPARNRQSRIFIMRQRRVSNLPQLRIAEMKRTFCKGPSKICSSCNRQLYKKGGSTVASGSEVEGHLLSYPILQRRVCDSTGRVGPIWLCITCRNYFSKGQLPPISTANSLDLAPCPPELATLNYMEIRMVSVKGYGQWRIL